MDEEGEEESGMMMMMMMMDIFVVTRCAPLFIL